eukprot:2902932-Rhodomonas_salina.2
MRRRIREANSPAPGRWRAHTRALVLPGPGINSEKTGRSWHERHALGSADSKVLGQWARELESRDHTSSRKFAGPASSLDTVTSRGIRENVVGSEHCQ